MRMWFLTAVAIALGATQALGQTEMQGVALDSPAMTEAEMTREDVAARLAAATPDAPAARGRSWYSSSIFKRTPKRPGIG